MARKKNYRPLIALAALAVAALALATMTFTNVTYWLINATLPPAMKYAGSDTTIANRADGSGYNNYVYVSYYYDPNSGYNVTRISIVGFTGDPTNYTDVLQLCNRYYSGTLYAKLVAKGYFSGQGTGYANQPQYIKDFRVYFYKVVDSSGNIYNNQTYGYSANGYYVKFVQDTVQVSPTSSVQIPPGGCAIVGAYVVVDPNLPAQYRDGKTVIAQYEVDVVFSDQP